MNSVGDSIGGIADGFGALVLAGMLVATVICSIIGGIVWYFVADSYQEDIKALEVEHQKELIKHGILQYNKDTGAIENVK